MPDIRAHLDAVASGKAPAAEARGSVIDPALVAKHKGAFDAWHSFAAGGRNTHRGGEPLHAPSEVLVPLP